MRTQESENSSIFSKSSMVAFAAFFVWGLLPVYWKGLKSIDSVEVLCHRMCWSLLTLIPMMAYTGRMSEAVAVLKNKKSLLLLTTSSLILGVNWGIYIWAVNANHVLDASLGYFITPLLNTALGVIFFKEKPRLLAWGAIVLAAIGVSYQIYRLGYFPVIAFAVGGTFAVYSLLRKVVAVESMPGLFVETLILFPLALGYLTFRAIQGSFAFSLDNISIDLLLIGSGLVTTIPLLAFAYGARRIPMTTLGLLQYVTPSIVFLLGIFLFDEAISSDGLITFGFIWLALALYTYDNLRAS